MKLAVAAVALFLAQGPQISWRSPDQFITIYRAEPTTVSFHEDGDISFVMEGKTEPTMIESKLDGLQLSARELTGLISRATDGKAARSFFKNVEATRDVTLALDSESRFLALVDQAKRFNLPAPETPESKDTTTLKTGVLAYTGNASDGTLKIPGEFNIQSRSAGKAGSVSFSQTLSASGQSGQFTLDPLAKLNPIRTGTIMGPVTLRIDRTETSPSKPEPQIIKVNLSADRVDLDLAEARTITLTGNVKMDGEQGLYAGSYENGTKAIITLNESMKPIKIVITGEPVDSRFQKKDGGK